MRPRNSSKAPGRVIAALTICIVAAGATVGAQVRFDSGQNVVPVFEGWERNADGSFTMVFGYLNRNYNQELDIAVGPNNRLEPGVPDQGQPTHFYNRRQQFVFKVRVPADWGKKDLTWTLVVGDKVEKAYGSLLPFWELGPFVYQENRGSTSTITDKPEPNVAPTIQIAGPAQVSATAGDAISLVANVSDDGHPVPRRRPTAATASAPATAPAPVRRDADGAVVTPTGTPGPGGTGPRRENPLTQAIVRLDPGVDLGVTWIVYRGSTDGVAFQPQRIPVENGTAKSQVKFARAGTYVLRAYADDGILITAADVTVTVRDAR